MNMRINYATQGGYDERDGLDLDRGRWMFDDEKRTQVWVQIEVPKPVSACECGASISKGSTKCRPCNLRTIRKVSTDPRLLVACPTCNASVAATCRTTGGYPAQMHIGRLAPRLCECGALAPRNRNTCDECRGELRRATRREASKRYREKVAAQSSERLEQWLASGAGEVA